MKKIKVLLSALAMIAAFGFVSCGGKAGDDSTGGTSGAEPAVPNQLVVFEGEKVIEITGTTNDELYGFALDFATPVEAGTGYKKVKVTASWEAEDGIQAIFQLKTSDEKQSSESISLSQTLSEVTGKCFKAATYKDYSQGGIDTPCADGAVKAQVFIQNGDYAAIPGKVTITKIVLSK